MSGRFHGSLHYDSHYIMMIIADKQLTMTHTVGFSMKSPMSWCGDMGDWQETLLRLLSTIRSYGACGLLVSSVCLENRCRYNGWGFDSLALRVPLCSYECGNTWMGLQFGNADWFAKPIRVIPSWVQLPLHPLHILCVMAPRCAWFRAYMTFNHKVRVRIPMELPTGILLYHIIAYDGKAILWEGIWNHCLQWWYWVCLYFSLRAYMMHGRRQAMR